MDASQWARRMRGVIEHGPGCDAALILAQQRIAELERENERLRKAHQNNVDSYDNWKRGRRVLAAPAYYMAEEARAALAPEGS